MAILPVLPNVEVHICVYDTPLEEYQDDDLPEVVREDHAAKVISRYIESQTDQEFSIRLTLKPPFLFDCPSLKFRIMMDGISVTKWDFSKNGAGMRRKVKSIEGLRREKEENKTILLPFKFSKIETSSDEGLLGTINEDTQRIAKIGEICVQVFRAGEIARVPKRVRNGRQPSANNNSEVHEKALKGEAKSHGVSYGEGRPVAAAAAALWSETAEILDGRDNPLARFIFKYRSKEALKALLIIKRTPSPDASPAQYPRNQVNLDNLDSEQKKQVESFVQDLLNGGETSGSSASRMVKRERDESKDGESSKRIRRKPEQIETIDLTED